jgi:beta-glucanase (GH16 family)
MFRHTFSNLTGLLIVALITIGTSRAHGDWKLVWSDDFSGNSLDTNHWTFETGNNDGWGNHELEYYTDSTENAYVSNSMLHIVARTNDVDDFKYTSARMKSAGLFFKKYGRFEFRAKFPPGKGFWPAIWLMPENSLYGGWPSCGEIDIVENKGDYPAVVQGTIHYADGNGKGLQSTGVFTFPVGDNANVFHTYDLDWTTNSISWSVDNQLYETQTNWSTGGAPYPAPFDQPFFIIMNLAVGGDFVGDPDSTTVFPGEMQVKYVRVYDLVTTNSMAN